MMMMMAELKLAAVGPNQRHGTGRRDRLAQMRRGHHEITISSSSCCKNSRVQVKPDNSSYKPKNTLGGEVNK